MDPSPLVNEQIDAGATLLAELEKRIPIGAGFWLKASDRDSWTFYVTSDRFEGEDEREARGEALRVAMAVGDPNLELLQMRLIKPGHPLARAALDYQRLYPGKVIRLRDRVFGDMGIDEVYIYPLPVAVSSVISRKAPGDPVGTAPFHSAPTSRRRGGRDCSGRGSRPGTGNEDGYRVGTNRRAARSVRRI